MEGSWWNKWKELKKKIIYFDMTGLRKRDVILTLKSLVTLLMDDRVFIKIYARYIHVCIALDI